MEFDSLLTYLKFLFEMADHTDYVGESISQCAHALQCAHIAAQADHSDEVIIASLLHDIGHMVGGPGFSRMTHWGVAHHEWIGAYMVHQFGFSKKIAILIGCHVDAKRYLVSKNKKYFNRLSAASKKTLQYQGGLMQDDEMRDFSQHPYKHEILQVRVNDEKAKTPGLMVPSFETYYALLEKHTHLVNRVITRCYLTNLMNKAKAIDSIKRMFSNF